MTQRLPLIIFALVMAMIPNIDQWNEAEKSLAARIIRAKAGAEEGLYLKLMQKHAALRDVLIRLGSVRD